MLPNLFFFAVIRYCFIHQAILDLAPPLQNLIQFERILLQKEHNVSAAMFPKLKTCICGNSLLSSEKKEKKNIFVILYS